MRIALPACALALALAPLAQAQTSAAYQERIRFDTCLGQIQLDASEALERAQFRKRRIFEYAPIHKFHQVKGRAKNRLILAVR